MHAAYRVVWGFLGGVLRAGRGLASRSASVMPPLPEPRCTHPHIVWGGNARAIYAQCLSCLNEEGKHTQLWSIDKETGEVQVNLMARLDMADTATQEAAPLQVMEKARSLVRARQPV